MQVNIANSSAGLKIDQGRSALLTKYSYSRLQHRPQVYVDYMTIVLRSLAELRRKNAASHKDIWILDLLAHGFSNWSPNMFSTRGPHVFSPFLMCDHPTRFALQPEPYRPRILATGPPQACWSHGGDEVLDLLRLSSETRLCFKLIGPRSTQCHRLTLIISYVAGICK